MSAPTLVAVNAEILGEPEPLLSGAGRASSLSSARSTLRRNVAVRGSSIGLGQGDQVVSAGDAFGDIWLPQSIPEVSGDLDGFGERFGVFVSNSFDSEIPIFRDAEKLCRSLNEGKSK